MSYLKTLFRFVKRLLGLGKPFRSNGPLIGYGIGADVLKALGVTASDVTGFTLTVPATDLIVLTVERNMTYDGMMGLLKTVDRYNLKAVPEEPKADVPEEKGEAGV